MPPSKVMRLDQIRAHYANTETETQDRARNNVNRLIDANKEARLVIRRLIEIIDLQKTDARIAAREHEAVLADLPKYAALGRACEANGLASFADEGSHKFQPPGDLIAEQTLEEVEQAIRRVMPLSATIMTRKEALDALATISTGAINPVAYRVKDFADGWILCRTLKEALRQQPGSGCLIEPLYAGRGFLEGST